MKIEKILTYMHKNCVTVEQIQTEGGFDSDIIKEAFNKLNSSGNLFIARESTNPVTGIKERYFTANPMLAGLNMNKLDVFGGVTTDREPARSVSKDVLARICGTGATHKVIRHHRNGDKIVSLGFERKKGWKTVFDGTYSQCANYIRKSK